MDNSFHVSLSAGHVFGAATLYDSRLTNSSYSFFVKDQVLSITVHVTAVVAWWSIWRLADNTEVTYLHTFIH